MDKTNGSGVDYTFTVKEVDASGNDFTPANYIKSENGLKVINTYASPKIDVTGTKEWVNGTAARPDVWFKLYRQIGSGTPVAVPGVSDLKIPATAPFTVKWVGVDQNDQDGATLGLARQPG